MYVYVVCETKHNKEGRVKHEDTKKVKERIKRTTTIITKLKKEIHIMCE